MSAATITDIQTQAPKFSRYRSVRRAAATPTIPEDAPPVPNTNSAQLIRAPSRYHRANRQHAHTIPLPTQPVINAEKAEPQPLWQRAQDKPTTGKPAAPIQTNALPVVGTVKEKRNADHEFTGGPVRRPGPSGKTTPNHERHLSRTASNATRSPTVASPRSFEAAREEARMILEGEYDRLQKMKRMQKIAERQKDSEVPDLRRRPTQVQQSKPQPVYVDAPKLNVKRKIQQGLPERYHDAPQSIGQRPIVPERQQRSSQPSETKHPANLKLPAPVEAPVTAVTRAFDAPKFDAPISAVNAGDRRVEVRLNNADRGITLPVTPTTNSRDLLNSASVVMSETFDPRKSVLVESFSQLGLERPLRRYEHVRDVMNSWDTDEQNHLTIMTESECQATGLERHEAPEDEGGRVMLQMYLSMRPGKWEKKWIILRPDGQVTMSKHENDGEGTNICHLSDFDVYTPTAKQRKKLKPPKKICFAIKSQQKSAMFLEGANFVHFFATSDKSIADRWYTAVQTWRSWYLVHVLGEGEKTVKGTPMTTGAPGLTEVRPSTAQSTDSVPYQLGSFKPLLDFSDLNFSASFDASEPDTKPKDGSILKKPSVDLGYGRVSTDVGSHETTKRNSRHRAMPPSSFPTKLLSEVEVKSRPSLDSGDQAFTGGGLLGRSMSTRRSQGGKPSGQGVSGAPGKPLVDLTPASEFAEGSLLRRLEARSAAQGENEPKIDRQRRIEADVKVGEGLV